MSQLPPGWEWTTLGEIAEVNLGQSPPGSTYNEVGDGVPFFQGKAEFGDLFPTASKWTTAPKKLARRMDVLLSVRAPVGPTNLAPHDCAIGRGLAAIRESSAVTHRYLLWVMRWSAGDLAARATGSTFAAVSGQQVRNHAIPLPPRAEQERIVAAIEERLSRLDAATRSLGSLTTRLASFRTRILDQVWEFDTSKTTLAEILSEPLANGRSVPTRAGGFPVLRLTALREREIALDERKDGDWDAETAERFLVQRGDFFISRGNGSLSLVGRGGLVGDDPDPVAYPDTLIRARVRPDRYSADFLSLAWDTRQVRRQIEAAARTTAGIYKVNQGTLRTIELPCPPLDVQTRIASAVQEALRNSARLAREFHRAERRSVTLRRSILAAAFSGSSSPRIPPTSRRQRSLVASVPNGQRPRSRLASGPELRHDDSSHARRTPIPRRHHESPLSPPALRSRRMNPDLGNPLDLYVLGWPQPVEGGQHISCLAAATRDARGATFRDLDSGVPTDIGPSPSWLGTLGYLALLEQIGKAVQRPSRADVEEAADAKDQALGQKPKPLRRAIRQFALSPLSDDQIGVLWDLRNAFAHDYGLLTTLNGSHRRRFSLFPVGPLVAHQDRGPDSGAPHTVVNVIELAELAEQVVKGVGAAWWLGDLESRLPPDELLARFTFQMFPDAPE